VDELAQCLRTWRDRVQPADVGLPHQALRRTPGLRRQELAQLAGLSVDYLTRLEQGRSANPSPQVLGALARALRLSAAEHAHLFRVAGQAPSGSGRMDRHLTPSIQRVLDRLIDVPVMVTDAAWTVVARNELASALLGDPSELRGRERNILWRYFTQSAPGRVVRDQGSVAAFEAEAVADLHEALGRYPADPELRSLIDDLRRASERFEELWQSRPVAPRASSRKTFEHPEVGRLTLDCDVLSVVGSDLRLVVYSAAPGSPDAEALALLGVVGLQRF
jgi:transcriptional regulator with XRE-family HTH domain